MKKLSILAFISLLITSCTVTIPMQTNLSDQTMLLAENRNIKANYTLTSNVPDGFIQYVSVLKNGNESYSNESYKYASTSAFNKLWESYFSSKFNSYSKEIMDIEISLLELKLREQASTSIGFTVLTGNSKVNVDAIAKVKAVISYHGEKYETQFEVNASDYNESQQMQAGNYSYTINQNNPTQQKSQLLDNCLNRSIIQFENFLRSVMLADMENK
ncbi:MAG: hypothetical protein JRJ57_01195 [Deltaproteobacteria bacterium]|nr:hypothetical protein [Deltaproteobacteria bacterium]